MVDTTSQHVHATVVWANLNDGGRYCLFVRPGDFDVKKWASVRAKEKIAAFRALGIIGLTEETICYDTETPS
jgi:hypothetical protein